MDARRQRRSSQSTTVMASATAPLLLLLSISCWSKAAEAAEDVAALTWTTGLQQHVAFFDKDGDGIVSFSETENGLRSLGLGAVTAAASATLINGVIGPKTRPVNATTSRFSIYIANIHKGIHGSDSGAYDSQGRFVPDKFAEIFSKHGKTTPDALTEKELEGMLHANRKDGDHKGWLASKSEWDMLYMLAKDKDGLLRKDTVRGVYDGSLFAKLASRKASSGTGDQE